MFVLNSRLVFNFECAKCFRVAWMHCDSLHAHPLALSTLVWALHKKCVATMKSCGHKRPPKKRSTPLPSKVRQKRRSAPLPSTEGERSRSPSASSSTHETFNLQRVNPTAHRFRNVEIEKLERTAKKIRDRLSSEEMKRYLKEPTKMLRRYLKENGYNGQQHSRWRHELRLHQALERPETESKSCAKGVSEDEDSESCGKGVSEDEVSESCDIHTQAAPRLQNKYRVRVVPRERVRAVRPKIRVRVVRPQIRYRAKVVAPTAVAEAVAPEAIANVVSQGSTSRKSCGTINVKVWASGVLTGEVVVKD